MTPARWDGYPDRASARRAAARTLHPDLGGDPAVFTAALAAIDVHFSATPPVIAVRRRRVLAGWPPLLLRRLRTRRRRFIEL